MESSSLLSFHKCDDVGICNIPFAPKFELMDKRDKAILRTRCLSPEEHPVAVMATSSITPIDNNILPLLSKSHTTEPPPAHASLVRAKSHSHSMVPSPAAETVQAASEPPRFSIISRGSSTPAFVHKEVTVRRWHSTGVLESDRRVQIDPPSRQNADLKPVPFSKTMKTSSPLDSAVPRFPIVDERDTDLPVPFTNRMRTVSPVDSGGSRLPRFPSTGENVALDTHKPITAPETSVAFSALEMLVKLQQEKHDAAMSKVLSDMDRMRRSQQSQIDQLQAELLAVKEELNSREIR